MSAFLKLYIVLIWVVLISFTGFELTCMLPVLKVSFHSLEQRYFKECLPYVIVWNLGMYNSLFTILLRFWVSVRTSLLSWKRFIKSVGKVVQWKSYTSLNWKNFITSLTFKKFKSQNFWFETWVSGGEKVKMLRSKNQEWNDKIREKYEMMVRNYKIRKNLRGVVVWPPPPL